MEKILKFYASFVRKYINKKKSIEKMPILLQNGYKDFLQYKDRDIIEFETKKYSLIKIKTKIFYGGEDLIKYIEEKVKDLISENDIITVAESVIGITQNRAYRLDEIKPSIWAYLLYPWVSNVDYGTGIGMPETMECALREVGLKRILKASIYAVLDRLKKRSGSFYKIAGKEVKSIDFKKNHPIPFEGSHNYIVLSPKEPEKFARKLSKRFTKKVYVAVVDANNVSVDILALYPYDKDLEKKLLKIMKGNPAGQNDEKTSIIIVREI